MGFFSGKKTINVASTVYNMSGDEIPRPNFLKSVVFSSIMSPQQSDLSGSIVSNYVNGPWNKQNRFFRWADFNDYVGMPSAQIDQQYSVDSGVVSGEIPVPSDPVGTLIRANNAFVTSGDTDPFVDQYIYENYPELASTDYLSEYYSDTHEFLISFEDSSTEIISAGDYDVNAQFIVAYYEMYLDSEVLDVVEGTLVTGVTNSGLLPDLTGFTLDSTTNTGVVTYTFADTSTEDFNTILKVYSKTEYLGGTGGGDTTIQVTTISIWEYRYVVDGDHLEPMYDHRTDTQDTIDSSPVGNPQVFIYKVGTGNTTLDDLASQGSPDSAREFYPLIPIRMKNRSIMHDNFADAPTGNGLYTEAHKAYKKLMGPTTKFSKLVDEIHDNDDIGDVDFAYIQFGVSLNSTDRVAKEYMYRFFKNLMDYQLSDSSYMGDLIDHVENYEADRALVAVWREAQTDPMDPLYDTPCPSFPPLRSPQYTTLRLQCEDYRLDDSDMRISWVSIEESLHTGLGKIGAKINELWFEKNSPLVYDSYAGTHYDFDSGIYTILSETNKIEKTTFYWQIDEDNYKKLTLYGLVHHNYIYKGKSVRITAHDALDDADVSGFLVPLHQPTVRDLGMRDSTQLALSNSYLVFNSYEVTKQKWYETFLGRLLIIIFIVVVSVLLSPASFASSGGILGSNVALGSSIGLTGIAGILAGAIANTMAAIIVSMIVSEGAVKIFGDKWGALIGAILSFAFTFGLAGGFSGNILHNLFTPANLLKLGNVLADGIQGVMQNELGEIQEKMIKAEEQYNARMKEIQDKLVEMGGNDLYFDPMQLTGVSAGNGLGIGLYMPETADEFIQRTLMVGSDIYDLTLGFVQNFTMISLTLPDND